MVSTRIFPFAALACVISGLASCAQQDVAREVEQQLAEHHISCLAMARPAYSPEHTECVLARYQERQRVLEVLRNAVAPPPPAGAPQAAASQAGAPQAENQAVWMQ